MILSKTEIFFKRLLILNVISLFICFSSFSQINKLAPSSARINSAANSDSSMNNVLWREKINKRTIYSSTYYGSNGEFKAVHSKRPINYYNQNKKLVPIDFSLKAQPNRCWAAFNQPNPTYFYPESASFALTLKPNARIIFGSDSLSDKTYPQKKENGFLYKNIMDGVDKEYFFLEDAVKYNYYVNKPLKNLKEELVFSEIIFLPKGFSLIKDIKNGQQKKDLWIGDLIVLDSLGKVFSKLHLPICVDSKKQIHYAGYRIRKENKSSFTNKMALKLEIVVSSKWLNNKSREFPVIIDPLIVGPTYQWIGGDMPSCVIQNYNVDSLLVTRPAGITITGLSVTANYYANVFAGAVKSDGKMFFSTDCANSQFFTITGPNGLTAGTAYLDSFSLTNPLTCCIPESCSDTSFYVRMHLGRNAIGDNTGLPLGTGCNTVYILSQMTSLWPFKVVISGHTAESYGNEWVVPQAPKCSNDCSISGYGYVRYGVAPYTFSHPWSSQVVTIGQNNGCASGATNFNFDMTIPNCPLYCDTNYTHLSIPPPQITDACGTSVVNISPDTVPIITAPQISVDADTLTCSGIPFEMSLLSCVPNTTISHWGNGVSGSDTIFDTVFNNSNVSSVITYQASGISNGCYSDTASFNMIIQPGPLADFTYSDPIITGVPVNFMDISTDPLSTIQEWSWTLNDSLISISDFWQNTFNLPSIDTICLTIVNDFGCFDSVCKAIEVYPAIVKVPNVITSNNDGVNDVLEFQYLEFYPNNELTIWNRWGNVIYFKEQYQNNWNGNDHPDGTYFFVLKNFDKGETYDGFFQLIKN